MNYRDDLTAFYTFELLEQFISAPRVQYLEPNKPEQQLQPVGLVVTANVVAVVAASMPDEVACFQANALRHRLCQAILRAGATQCPQRLSDYLQGLLQRDALDWTHANLSALLVKSRQLMVLGQGQASLQTPNELQSLPPPGVARICTVSAESARRVQLQVAPPSSSLSLFGQGRAESQRFSKSAEGVLGRIRLSLQPR